MRHRGFTLLEVLVALSLLAIGLAAAARVSLISADSAESLQQRQLAGWVAENHLALLRATRTFPETGKRSGSAEIGKRQFRWHMEIDEAAQGHFRRVEIVVTANDQDDRLASLVTYLGKP